MGYFLEAHLRPRHTFISYIEYPGPQEVNAMVQMHTDLPSVFTSLVYRNEGKHRLTVGDIWNHDSRLAHWVKNETNYTFSGGAIPTSSISAPLFASVPHGYLVYASAGSLESILISI